MTNVALEAKVVPICDGQARVAMWMEGVGIDVRSAVWLYPTSVTQPYAAIAERRIDWTKFLIPLSGSLEANPDLGDTLRWLAACWLSGCGGEFHPVTWITTRIRLCTTRRMLAVLLVRGASLETLTPKAVQQTVLGQLVDGHGVRLKAQTLYQTMHAVRDLFRLRAYLPSGFALDPFPPDYVKSVCCAATKSRPWTAPPEPVCLELIREAIRLLGLPADDVIRLRDRYILACESAKRRGHDRKRVHNAARRTLKDERFSTLPGKRRPWIQLSPQDTISIKRLVAAIEGGCAAVLLFLSGPRVSEILRAGPGCLRFVRHANGIEYPYFCADRSKNTRSRAGEMAATVHVPGNERGWILGPAGVRALQVLARLSRLPRKLSGINCYWVSTQCTGLWPCTRRTGLTATSPEMINRRLNIFAGLVHLTEQTGWTGRLHSHMGRKACARFIAKRDRTALADLALQFGHLSAYATDVCYARPDAEYRRLIEDELVSEMQAAAADLAALDVQHTFSHMHGAELSELRNRAIRFVGELRSTQEVRRMLGQGVRLVPCDWGMCVYREQASLCGGNQYGPSAERRSPVVCRNCLNFVATEQYRPYWRRRVKDCRQVLTHRGLPEQTASLVRARLSEAEEVLAALAGKEGC